MSPLISTSQVINMSNILTIDSGSGITTKYTVKKLINDVITNIKTTSWSKSRQGGGGHTPSPYDQSGTVFSQNNLSIISFTSSISTGCNYGGATISCTCRDAKTNETVYSTSQGGYTQSGSYYDFLNPFNVSIYCSLSFPGNDCKNTSNGSIRYYITED